MEALSSDWQSSLSLSLVSSHPGEWRGKEWKIQFIERDPNLGRMIGTLGGKITNPSPEAVVRTYVDDGICAPQKR